MSRSYQHHALKNKFRSGYWAVCSYFSNKKDKLAANRRFRRRSRMIANKDDGDGVYPIMREVSNTWDFSSDGLAYYHSNNARSWQKDYNEEDIKRFTRK